MADLSAHGLLEHRGWWLAERDKHLREILDGKDGEPLIGGRPSFQDRKLRAALAFLPLERRGLALDVGAHAGFWSASLALEFKAVWAFEPVEENRRCFMRNVREENVSLHRYAVGASPGWVRVGEPEPKCSAWCRVLEEAREYRPGFVSRITLDGLMSPCRVDFLKIDTEGYELFVLQGAEKMLRRDQPVVVVEQKPGNAEQFGVDRLAGVKFLQSLGARVLLEYAGDFTMGW